MNFCKCGSIIQDGICSNRHCDSRNEALTSWLIDGTLWRFKQPVTLTEAQEVVRNKSDVVYKIKPPGNGFMKMPTW